MKPEGLQKNPCKSLFHVRLIGLEPTRIAAPDPKSGVSTNSTTGAKLYAKVRHFYDLTKYLGYNLAFNLLFCKFAQI